MRGEVPREPRIPEQIYAVIGHPLGHSLSPAAHNLAFELAEVPAAYLRRPVAPGELAEFMRAVRSLPVSGLSVTIPHKRSIMEQLDGVDHEARSIGAVNTVYWGSGSILGTNTDSQGFLKPLIAEGIRPRSAFVLGAGGAARAVLAALRTLGCDRLILCARGADKARETAEEFGADTASWEERGKDCLEADLLVNATPLGMAGSFEGISPLEGACLSPNQTVYDLVYNPLKTPLLEQAESMGCRTVDGLAMFLGQAGAQFELWTGRAFPETEVRRLLASMLV
jgi:shikimate dehydrogenase